MSDFDDLAEIAAQNSIRQNSRVTKRRGWGIGPNIEHGSPKREKPQPLSTPKPKTEVKPIEVTPAIIESLDRFCVYGVATDYETMIELVRYRLEELNTTHESVDDVSGLHGGYTSKLVAPVPIKSMGKTSMGPMLQTLGLALIVVRDDAQFARIKDRLAKRERPRQLPSIAGKPVPTWLFTKKKAREMGKRRFQLMSDAERKRHQRKAQKASVRSRRRAKQSAGREIVA